MQPSLDGYCVNNTPSIIFPYSFCGNIEQMQNCYMDAKNTSLTGEVAILLIVIITSTLHILFSLQITLK